MSLKIPYFMKWLLREDKNVWDVFELQRVFETMNDW